MKKQYTLKVYPAGQSRTVYRVLEISGEDTLDDLCRAILDAFDFIDGHLYEFCMDNRMYTDYSYQADPEGDGPSTAIEIDKLYLQDGQNFMLHYDFGDDWQFMIHVQKMEDAVEYASPRVIREKGVLEQYPDWEEEDEEEEEEEEF